jgi:hypothetical protein
MNTSQEAVEIMSLIQGLDLQCKTQVSCRRSRGELLKIKKLTDVIRKQLLTHSAELKDVRKPKEPKQEPVAEPVAEPVVEPEVKPVVETVAPEPKRVKVVAVKK